MQSIRLNVDDSIERTGGFGKFQRRVVALMCVTYVPCCINMALPVYMKPKLVAEWDGLSEVRAEMLGTLFFVGFWIGSFVLGSCADKFGRRNVINVSLLSMLLLTALSFFATSFSVLAASRVAAGFASAGAFNSCIVLALEVVPRHWRIMTKTLLGIMWDVGLLLYTGVAFAVREQSWRALTLVNVTTAAALILNAFLLPESPRFLLVNGSTQKAAEAFTEIATINGATSALVGPDEGQESDTQGKLAFQLEEPKPTDGRNPFFLLWRREVVVLTLVIGFLQMAETLGYYGLTFSGKLQMSKNLYISTIFGAFSEIPGIVLTAIGAQVIGRKNAYAAMLGLLSLTFGASAIVGDEGPLADALIIIGRFAGGGVAMICFVVAAECFPTECRNAGVGWGSSCGRIGAMIAPLTADHRAAWPAYSAINFFAMVLALCVLPETSQRDMDGQDTEHMAIPTSPSADEHLARDTS